MKKYNRYSLALNDEENDKFLKIHKENGYGIKKIFMAMINVLDIKETKEVGKEIVDEVKIEEEEE